MSTRIAFLRAINLGAKRKFPKDAIVAATEAAGFTGVATHINTGNVRFETTMRSRARIEAALEAAYLADRGFEVRVISYTAQEVAQIAETVAELDAGRPDLSRHYVNLLGEDLDEETAARVEALSGNGHEAVVRGRAVHLLLGPDYQPGQVDPLRVEKYLTLTTNRNATVVRAVAEKWC